MTSEIEGEKKMELTDKEKLIMVYGFLQAAKGSALPESKVDDFLGILDILEYIDPSTDDN